MIPDKQDPDISVEIKRAFNGIDISSPKIKQLVEVVCNRFTDSGLQDTKYEINIAIVDDDGIRNLNKEFLNSESNTDCISFDLSDEENGVKFFDLAVNGEMAVRQAAQRGHSSQAELALYITHGLLHNLGFDDSTENEARKMHETEDNILQEFGYGMVYNKDKRSDKH
jgi:probable rRNA maturation factor